MNDPELEPSTGTTFTPATPSPTKVIEPLTFGLQPDPLSDTNPITTEQGQPQNVPTIATADPAPVGGTRPQNYNPSSIYPTPSSATPGAAIATVPPRNAPAPTGEPIDSGTPASTGAIVLGTYIGVVSLYQLQGYSAIFSAGAAITWQAVLAFVVTVIQLIVGVGIAMRKEVARKAYLFIVILGIVMSTYSTFALYSGNGALGKLRATYQSQIMKANQDTASLEADSTISASQKNLQLQILQARKASAQKQLDNAQPNYARIIITYIIALLPIVFLTRPSVKAVFE